MREKVEGSRVLGSEHSLACVLSPPHFIHFLIRSPSPPVLNIGYKVLGQAIESPERGRQERSNDRSGARNRPFYRLCVLRAGHVVWGQGDR